MRQATVWREVLCLLPFPQEQRIKDTKWRWEASQGSHTCSLAPETPTIQSAVPASAPPRSLFGMPGQAFPKQNLHPQPAHGSLQAMDWICVLVFSLPGEPRRLCLVFISSFSLSPKCEHPLCAGTVPASTRDTGGNSDPAGPHGAYT